MELNHSVPLQYDFLRISNMLPEALEYGGKCVPRQCEVLLKRNCDDDFQRLWQKQSEAPWDGRVTTEMMQEFCAQNNINLMAFHGNRKVVHQTATSDVWLTYFLGGACLFCHELKAICTDAFESCSQGAESGNGP